MMLADILGGWEIVLILAAILILFGAKKLPDLAKGMGRGFEEFREATKEVNEELLDRCKQQEEAARAEDFLKWVGVILGVVCVFLVLAELLK